MLYNFDSQEREGYTALLHYDNFENNLDTTIADTKIEADQLYSGYVYSDINDRKQNPILKLLFAIDNIKSKTTVANNTAFPIITYHSKDCFILLNDWKDTFYFLAAFPTWFLFGEDRLLEKRQ